VGLLRGLFKAGSSSNSLSMFPRESVSCPVRSDIATALVYDISVFSIINSIFIQK